jgi:hypothetical protein
VFFVAAGLAVSAAISEGPANSATANDAIVKRTKSWRRIMANQA